MKPDRLYERVKHGHKHNVRFADFVALMEAFGFEHTRTKGSHNWYVHETGQVRMSVQPDRNGNAKAYQIADFLKYVAEHALSMKERE